jgi:hypothetical protein
MTNSSPQPPKPTDKQLRYLRHLAASRGQTFTPPRTRTEASAEIERLKAARPQSRGERGSEIFAGRERIADRWGPATAVRPDEIEGYGSNCRWLHQTQD